MASSKVADNVVVATRAPYFQPLLDMGATLCPRETAVQSGSVIDTTKKGKLHPLLDYVATLDREPEQRWRVWSLQDENYKFVYFATRTLEWLWYVMPCLPNTLFEQVQGAKHAHRFFLDIDHAVEESEPPVTLAVQLKAIGALKAFLRIVVSHVWSEVDDVRIFAAQSTTETKVSWHLIVHMYNKDGEELCIQDTYHLLGFAEYLRDPGTRVSLMPGIRPEHASWLDDFIRWIDISVYGSRIRAFRCLGQTKANKNMPLCPFPQMPITMELFSSMLIVPVKTPRLGVVVTYSKPKYNRRTAKPAWGVPLPLTDRRAQVPAIWSSGQQDTFRFPPERAYDVRVTRDEWQRYGSSPAALFAIYIQRAHGAHYLPADGCMVEMRDSDAARGVVQIAGGLFCESKGSEHRSNTTYLHCMFAPVHGFPWYKQRCFDRECVHNTRVFLPAYVALLMQQSAKLLMDTRSHADVPGDAV